MLKLLKFVSYFENGILNIDFSKPFNDKDGKIPQHAEIIKGLQAKGIRSGDLVSAGSAIYMPDGGLRVIDNRYFSGADIDDVIALLVNAKREYNYKNQGLLDFGKER